ncbi:MAG TPA: lysylphosphatidylglycerol synthase transmembrane domain-containing protein [Candidatus Acidoferrales bacterium]|nr:lysylphosphatidylglycerol synthase transmembrane domain-containing protein [Candidatus Acidoferrales bacterium]
MTLSEANCYGAKSMLRNSRRLFLLLLAVAALGYLFYKFRHSITLEGFEWSTVGQSLRDARLSLLLLTMATIYVCFAIRALRWMRFSRTLGATDFRNVYSATLMGFTCTFLLGRAGEPIRPVLIAKKDKLSIPRMFGVYVLERIFDVAATAVIAGSALVLFERRGLVGHAGDIVTKVRSAGILLLIGLLVAVSFLIYFRYHGAEWLAKRLQKPAWRAGWRGKVIVLLEGFAEGLQGIRTWNDLGVLVGLSVVHWFLIVLCYTWVAHAFGGQLGTLRFSDAALVLAFSMVGSAVQLPGVGGGAQVATFLVLTLIFGVEKVPAAAMSIVVWLVTFASCCLVGLPLLFREGWSMGELRKMATDAEHEAESAAEEIVLGGHPAKPGDETR